MILTDKGKIVVEMKAVAHLSESGLNRLAKDAMSNRGASYCIMIVKDATALPAAVGAFNEYKTFTVISLNLKEINSAEQNFYSEELLSAAYHIAQLRLENINVSKNSTTLDSSTLDGYIDQIRKRVIDLAKIQAHCNVARKELAQIEQISSAVHAEIEADCAKLSEIMKSKR